MSVGAEELVDASGTQANERRLEGGEATVFMEVAASREGEAAAAGHEGDSQSQRQGGIRI